MAIPRGVGSQTGTSRVPTPKRRSTSSRSTSSSRRSSSSSRSPSSSRSSPVTYRPSSGSLDPNQIASAAYQAGFRGSALTTIVAIALAESRGNPTALNPNGEHSVGLTQINMNAHGSRFGSERDLYDPVTNMKAAYALSGGGRSFQPWTTYTGATSHGAGNSYRRFLNVAQQATGQAASTPVPTVSSSGSRSSGGGSYYASRTGGTDSSAAQAEADRMARLQAIQNILSRRNPTTQWATRTSGRRAVPELNVNDQDYENRLNSLTGSLDFTPSVMRNRRMSLQGMESLMGRSS